MQENYKILVVDDDMRLRALLERYLTEQGFQVRSVANAEQMDRLLTRESFHLMELDLMLPGMDGIEICRRIRAISDVPIIMLTARSDTQDVVAGLEAGADDYVAKPFKNRELMARVRTRLRRVSDVAANAEPPKDKLRIGDIDIDVLAHEARRAGQVVPLTPLEFDLVVTLAREPWKVFTREELLERVWGYQHSADNRLVNVHVQRLRAKVELDPEHPKVVITVRGVGYRAGSAQG